MQVNNFSDPRIAKIQARLDLLDDENADRHGASPGYALEDIQRIINGEEPLSTKENQKS
jgi:hypothetical protein